jgi:uncharacterized protein YkwD
MMKDARGYRRIFWAVAAALVFGCSLVSGSIPGALSQGSVKDLAAFMPPSNTPFLPNFATRTSTPADLLGDPATATFTVVIVFSETVTPVSTPTETLMMFPSQTPTMTLTIYILPTVTPIRAYQPQSQASSTPRPMVYPSATPTVSLPPSNTSTPLPTATAPSGGDGAATSEPSATPLPIVTSANQPLPTATPTPTATFILQPSATPTATMVSTGCVVYNYDYESQTASLLNQQRNQNGLPSLSVNGALTDSARGHSVDMVTHNLTQHNGSDGSTPRQRMIRAGYTGSWWGEIIYWGSGSYGTPSQAVTWWMNDPPHKDVILGTHYTDFGVGYVSCPSFSYKGFFTVDFGGP